jgi:hypothetical protein
MFVEFPFELRTNLIKFDDLLKEHNIAFNSMEERDEALYMHGMLSEQYFLVLFNHYESE